MKLGRVQVGLRSCQERTRLRASNGKIELTPPMTDDDRRDFEVHLKSHFGFNLALQIKSRFVLKYLTGMKGRYLQIIVDDTRGGMPTCPSAPSPRELV